MFPADAGGTTHSPRRRRPVENIGYTEPRWIFLLGLVFCSWHPGTKPQNWTLANQDNELITTAFSI